MDKTNSGGGVHLFSYKMYPEIIGFNGNMLESKPVPEIQTSHNITENIYCVEEQLAGFYFIWPSVGKNL